MTVLTGAWYYHTRQVKKHLAEIAAAAAQQEAERKAQIEHEEIIGGLQRINQRQRLRNDELRLQNAEIEADIARLEGRQPNTVKLDGLRAIIRADRMAIEMDNDLQDLINVLSGK